MVSLGERCATMFSCPQACWSFCSGPCHRHAAAWCFWEWKWRQFYKQATLSCENTAGSSAMSSSLNLPALPICLTFHSFVGGDEAFLSGVSPAPNLEFGATLEGKGGVSKRTALKEGWESTRQEESVPKDCIGRNTRKNLSKVKIEWEPRGTLHSNGKCST